MSATIHELRPSVRPADRAGPEAERVRGWMRGVLRRPGGGRIAPGRLARLAGVSPTTVTRFLNGATDQLPKMSTLDAIARAAGVPSPATMLTLDSQPFVDIPVVLPAIWRMSGKDAAVQKSADTTRAPARFIGCVAVRITADTASLAGVLLGDTVLADPDRHPGLNDLVVVALDTGQAGLYRVAGPLLMPQAPGNLPALVNDDTVDIIGVAVQVQRELA